MAEPYEHGPLKFTPSEASLHEEAPTPASWHSSDVTSDFGELSAELAMSDPFELRLHFSNCLRALNPCDDNTDEVVSFALRHRELDEDLHSCILEQLESVSTYLPLICPQLLRMHANATMIRRKTTSMSGQTSSTSWSTCASWRLAKSTSRTSA
jgi:CTD kinase subunit gamma CTK3